MELNVFVQCFLFSLFLTSSQDVETFFIILIKKVVKNIKEIFTLEAKNLLLGHLICRGKGCQEKRSSETQNSSVSVES